MKTALVTGGAGYVGAACCKALAAADWKVVVYDNLSSGSREAVEWGSFVKSDIADRMALAAAFAEFRPDVVVHLAAFTSLPESVDQPAMYYRNNTFGTLALLEQMQTAGVSKLIFASSCATYGIPACTVVDEQHAQRPINPYGRSKLMAEQMIRDIHARSGLNAIMFRYFNVAGVDPDCGLTLGSSGKSSAISLLAKLAVRGGGEFVVNGTNYDTADGSAVRDYVHVMDLSQAHVLAAEKLMVDEGLRTYNLGSGVGTSVLELLTSIRRLRQVDLKVRFGPRRTGDAPSVVASIGKARQELGWCPVRSDLDRILESALNCI
jgi:UDP-arabinose 4-epimerase